MNSGRCPSRKRLSRAMLPHNYPQPRGAFGGLMEGVRASRGAIGQQWRSNGRRFWIRESCHGSPIAPLYLSLFAEQGGNPQPQRGQRPRLGDGVKAVDAL